MKYSDLVVWQKAMDLVENIYDATRSFPAEERFCLTSQMQRASVSIPSNIAEGHGRKATNAYLNYLSIAFGSLMELETQIQIAHRLGYFTQEQQKMFLVKTEEIGKMMSGLIKSLRNQSTTPNPQSSILNPDL